MIGYVPPFTINHKMMTLVASISEKVGRMSGYRKFDSRPHLRKINRIRSIHSSLRIEANSLSLSEVRAVIDGHQVVGDEKEITEVKDAYKAYGRIPDINPYSIDALKATHALMMDGVADDRGNFRRGNEGVFSGDECIFIAPPPAEVPSLMEKLFSWMNENREQIHPLILSAVFHYEFVFIHPFSDGNGRMARLWHTVLLYNWKDIFESVPIESNIESSQEQYYEAISKCHVAGNSDAFIEFMLEHIDEILDELAAQMEDPGFDNTERVKKLLAVMQPGNPYTLNNLMEALGLKAKASFMIHYLRPAMEAGAVKMTIPDKPRSKNQRYVRV